MGLGKVIRCKACRAAPFHNEFNKFKNKTSTNVRFYLSDDIDILKLALLGWKRQDFAIFYATL